MTNYCEKLKKETFPLHQRLDQLATLKRLMSLAVKEEDYVQFLRANYLAYTFLSKKSPTSINKERIYQLEKDLKSLSHEVVDFPLELNFNTNDHPAFEWGVFYVLEGARHGAPYIKSHLQKTITDLENHAFTFLSHTSSSSWQEVLKKTEDCAKKDYPSLLLGVEQTYKVFIDIFEVLYDSETR